MYFIDFLHAFSITEHPNKWTITKVRFNKRINIQVTFIWIHVSWYSEWRIQFLICSFTYIRDVITKIKIIFYGELYYFLRSSHEKSQRLLSFPRVIKWHFLGLKTKTLSKSDTLSVRKSVRRLFMTWSNVFSQENWALSSA